MVNQPLSGKKIAVLVESQYIPVELKTYQTKFKQLGATVHLVSRMWGGRNTQECVSELESDDAKKLKDGTLSLEDMPQFLTADVDVEKVQPEDYDAVIMAANYTSVRLRHYVRKNRETPRSTPAVRFFARAMRNPKIIKGALCHGLWILTPYPELLAGRVVICNEVLHSDIENAGAIVRFPENPRKDEGVEWVLEDDDLVTGHSYHETEAFIDVIKDKILVAAASDGPPWVQTDLKSTMPFRLDKVKRSSRQILVLLSEWGYWGEELVGPVEVFAAAKYEVQFITPTGKRPNAIKASMDPEFVDPPLGRPVTSEKMGEKVKRWDDPATPEGKRLEKPCNLSEWFPERPYFSSPASARLLERYYRELARVEEDLQAFDALLIVGGSGPLVDLVNNQRVHDLILGFRRAGKPIAAECYGVTCLAFARDWEDRKSIIAGKHVTGHCKEYDYKDGTGFMKARGQFLDFNMGPPPYPLEYILRDATAPGGQYHGNVGHETSVIVDYPFITGRSTPDSYLTGQKLVEVLDGDPPLRRWGW
jgi:putative intracellular protease/amidase